MGKTKPSTITSGIGGVQALLQRVSERPRNRPFSRTLEIERRWALLFSVACSDERGWQPSQGVGECRSTACSSGSVTQVD